MSFWPLARTLTDHLDRAARLGPILELGSGGGRLMRRLQSTGLECWGLDLLYPPAPEGLIAVAGDARALPFRDAGLGAILIPNLLRHLSRAAWPLIAQESRRVLGHGGIVVVLEDLPEARNQAEANYRRVLEQLAAASPARVSACLERDLVQLAMEDSWGAPHHRDVHENEEVVERPTAPLEWLRTRDLTHSTELENLSRAVEEHGMSYGRYWSLVYRNGEDRVL